MNQQQLQIARAAHWHQNAQPLLTLDDSAGWIEETGLCLFLPRHAQLPAPAPSFVEACAGQASATPPAGAIDRAMELVAPLIEDGRVIPLNLLGTFSEQPDFLMSAEVLRWTAAVRGDRSWKTVPGGRTAPIVVRVWESLDREGPSTAAEIQERLGRELTEAAILRALIELWSTFRAVPSYASGQPTRWNLLKARHAGELAAAGNTAQTTALSVLVSQYLRSAVAATAEETEIFLSPLTARSRIREVVHGMMATRQLATTTVGTQTLVFVEGSLEELLPEAPLAEPEAELTSRGVTAAGKETGPALPPGRRRELGRKDIEKPGQKRAWKPRPGREQERGAFQRPERDAERGAGARPAAGGGQRRDIRGGQFGQDRRGGRPPFRPEDRKPGDRPAGDRTAGRPGDRKQVGAKRTWQPGGARPPARFGPARGEERGGEFREKRFGAKPGEGREDRTERRKPSAPRDRKQPWQNRDREEGRRASPGDRGKGPQRGEKREGGWKPFTRGAERARPRREGAGPPAERPQRPGFFGGKEKPRGKGGPPRGGRPQRQDRPRREDRPGFQKQGFAGRERASSRQRPPSQARPATQGSSTQDRSAGSGTERGGRKFGGGQFGGKPSFGGPGGTRPRSFSGPKGRFGPGKPRREGSSGPPNRSERGKPQGRPFRKGPPRRADQNPRKEENPE